MNLPEKIKKEKRFKACPKDPGDELFPNGIFEFNITKMQAFIDTNKSQIIVQSVDVELLYDGIPRTLNEASIESANLSIPIILAEISPGRFVVVDGNHRLEKAHRTGAKKVPAYKLSPKQFLKFLVSERAYFAFVDYWNGKVDDICEDQE